MEHEDLRPARPRHLPTVAPQPHTVGEVVGEVERQCQLTQRGVQGRSTPVSSPRVSFCTRVPRRMGPGGPKVFISTSSDDVQRVYVETF